MAKSRRIKPGKLLKAIERLRLKAGERPKRILRRVPAQKSFESFYLD
jgi:hypothetical protein